MTITARLTIMTKRGLVLKFGAIKEEKNVSNLQYLPIVLELE
jgi:hypothetical protein